MKITTVGIDLAKNVIQVHGVDEHGKTVLKKQLKRGEVHTYFTNREPALIGLEACASAHHWARQLQVLGHTVKLMVPQFVKPYVKPTRLTPPTPRRSAKRWPAPTCASCR